MLSNLIITTGIGDIICFSYVVSVLKHKRPFTLSLRIKLLNGFCLESSMALYKVEMSGFIGKR